ncbi:site-determining protein [Clostridia bacterium]|nr:site-determining protein [Clostridia bacterium]
MDQATQLRSIIKRKDQQQFVPKQESLARVITVTSGKGGVGKSNVSVNLALQLTKMGHKVIIFDADFGLANVEVMFGVSPKYTLKDMVFHGMSMKDIITEGPLGLGFISGGSGVGELNNLSREQTTLVTMQLKELDHMADFVIIDTGAGIGSSVLDFVLASPEVLIVSTMDPSSLTDSYSLLKALHRSSGFRRTDSKIQVVANRVSGIEEGRKVFEKLDSVVHQYLGGNISYLGMIPQDTLLERAIRSQKPVSVLYPESRSAKAFEILADNLLTGSENLPKEQRGIGKVLSDFMLLFAPS